MMSFARRVRVSRACGDGGSTGVCEAELGGFGVVCVKTIERYGLDGIDELRL